jgi:ankyrin repeat protein
MDTPLHRAVKCCVLFSQNHKYDAETHAYETHQMGFIMYLLNSGIDVNLKDSDGFTAEDLAKRAGFPRIESLLFIAAVVSRRY